MKNFLLLLILSFIFCVISPKAQAYGYRSSYSSNDNGWIINLDGMYYWNTDQNGNTTTTVTRQVVDPYIGYHFGMLYIAGTYDYDAQVTTKTNTAQSTESFRSYGGTVGLWTENVYLTFTYYFSSIGTLNGGTTSAVDLTNGSGYMADLGYMFDLGSGFKLGPSVSYKSLTYNTISNNPNNNYVFSTFLPHINIAYNF